MQQKHLFYLIFEFDYNILSMIVWEKDIFISNKTQTPWSLNFLLIFVFQ